MMANIRKRLARPLGDIAQRVALGGQPYHLPLRLAQRVQCLGHHLAVFDRCGDRAGNRKQVFNLRDVHRGVKTTAAQLALSAEAAAIGELQDPNLGCASRGIKPETRSIKINEDVLHDVFRLPAIVQNAIGNAKHQPPVSLIQDRNGISMLMSKMREQFLIGQAAKIFEGESTGVSFSWPSISRFDQLPHYEP